MRSNKILDNNIKYDKDGTISGRNGKLAYTSKLAKSSPFIDEWHFEEDGNDDGMVNRKQGEGLRIDGFSEQNSSDRKINKYLLSSKTILQLSIPFK